MTIDAIYIGCYKYDVRLARILVASIRTWYPDIPICLIKDTGAGDFNTREFESAFGCTIFPTGQRRFGWGFHHLAPLLQQKRERCLILDADIVFLGPVLEVLERYNEDFIVHHEEPSEAFVRTNYFDLDHLRTVDPEFPFAGLTFNAGQLVATSGVLTSADFDPYVRWAEPPVVRRPDVFKNGDQGLLNYLLTRKASRSELTLRRMRFMEVADSLEYMDANYQRDAGERQRQTMVFQRLRVEELTAGSPYRAVMHWCGLHNPTLARMPRADILLHFQALFYSRVRFGRAKEWWRRVSADAELRLRVAVRSRPALKAPLKRLLAAGRPGRGGDAPAKPGAA